jgi:hypothetical protein
MTGCREEFPSDWFTRAQLSQNAVTLSEGDPRESDRRRHRNKDPSRATGASAESDNPTVDRGEPAKSLIDAL